MVWADDKSLYIRNVILELADICHVLEYRVLRAALNAWDRCAADVSTYLCRVLCEIVSVGSLLHNVNIFFPTLLLCKDTVP